MAREKTVRARMTEGEILLLLAKAAREERSVSAVIRQAIAEYEPIAPTAPSSCMTCDEDEDGNECEPVLMQPILFDDERTLDVAGKEHTITITGIPARKCPRCGDVTVNYALELELEKAILRMVNYYARKNKEWPAKISLEELSRLM